MDIGDSDHYRNEENILVYNYIALLFLRLFYLPLILFEERLFLHLIFWLSMIPMLGSYCPT